MLLSALLGTVVVETPRLEVVISAVVFLDFDNRARC